MNNRIRQLREENNMTQIRLSIELEVSQETVSAYESGKHFPSVSILLKMANIFNTSIDYILCLSDTRYPNTSNKLSEDEQMILGKWKKLDDRRKELLLAYIEGMNAIK